MLQFTQLHPTQQPVASGQLSTSTIYQGYSQNYHSNPNVGLYAAIHVQIDLHVSLQGDATQYRLVIIFVIVDALLRAVWRTRVIGLGL